MATVVDALVTTIGLDTRQFDVGKRSVETSLAKLKIEGDRFAKEFEASGKTAAQFFAQAKTEALGLIGTLVGAGGMAAFIKDTTNSLADLGRTATNIGLSVPQLNAFQNVIERNGGSAASATQSMKGLVDQIERFKVFGDPTVFKFLNPIGASIDDTPLGIWQKFVEFADKHQNDPALVNLIGKGLGFDQGLINASMQIHGATDAVQQLHNEMQRVATPDMVKNATELQKAWEDLQHQAIFTGEAVANNLSPALQSILKWGTAELQQNPELVTALTAVVAGFTTLSLVRISASLMGLTGLSAAIAGTLGMLEKMVPLLALLGFTGPAGDPTGEDQQRQVKEDEAKAEEYRRTHGSLPTVGGQWSEWWRNNMPTWLGGGGQPPIADQSMDPVQQKFLQTLSAPESGGAYDVKNGGAHFTDLSRFPEGVGAGGTSSASGRYQFVSGTWREQQAALGLPDFSPASQDKAAWFLAAKTYRAKTGRDLETDLKAGGHEDQIAAAVGQHWGTLSADRLRAARVATAPVSSAPGTDARPGAIPGTEARGGPPIRIDPWLVPQPGAPVTNSSLNSTNVQINGGINVHTPATDAAGIANDLHGAVTDAFVQQANRGLQ